MHIRLIIFISFSLLMRVGFNHAATVVITGDNWCPINCAQNSEKQGFMIEVANEALAHANVKVEYIEMPWSRSVELARQGKIHAIVGAFKGDAPDFLFPHHPLLNLSSSSVFTKGVNSFTYTGLASLDDKKVGVISGYDYGEKFNQYLFQQNALNNSRFQYLHGNDAVKRGIELLARGRIDVFVESEPVFWHQAAQLSLSDSFKYIGSIAESEPCFIAFSPTHPMSLELVKAFDKGVKELLENGRLLAISEKYTLPRHSVFELSAQH